MYFAYLKLTRPLSWVAILLMLGQSITWVLFSFKKLSGPDEMTQAGSGIWSVYPPNMKCMIVIVLSTLPIHHLHQHPLYNPLLVSCRQRHVLWMKLTNMDTVCVTDCVSIEFTHEWKKHLWSSGAICCEFTLVAGWPVQSQPYHPQVFRFSFCDVCVLWHICVVFCVLHIIPQVLSRAVAGTSPPPRDCSAPLTSTSTASMSPIWTACGPSLRLPTKCSIWHSPHLT